jgi:hypothetical protein
VLSCVGRGLGAGLIPRPRSPTKCLKGSISKKENPTREKGIRKNEKKEEDYIKPVPKVCTCHIDTVRKYQLLFISTSRKLVSI